jgi:hypothetical protein
MRATKAYIASLGTTGLLLASAGSLLLVVGALFAFNGWPGADVTEEVDSLVVEQDEPFRVSGPEQVARDAAPGARAVRGGRRGGDTAGGRDGDGGGAPGPGEPGEPREDPDGRVDGPGDGGDPGGGGGGGGGGVDTGTETNALAGATEQTTRNLGNAVNPVSPAAGQGVSQTGEALSDIVRDLPDVQAGDDGSLKVGE